MENTISYKKTVLACYIGNFSQAMVVNLTPIIFIPLRTQFGISYSQFGLLVLVNFITQVIVDISFSKPVEKYGFRPFVVGGHIVCVAGLLLFALSPLLFGQHVFFGFLLSTVIFSGAGGLLELSLSPIIDAIPTGEKDKAMAWLHSFYAWGQVAVVLVTTLLLFANVYWAVIVAAWTIVPFVNIFLFSVAPIAQKDASHHSARIRNLIKNPVFIIAFLCILSGGAAELSMSQWASALMEKALGLPKVYGDMLGMCGFAFMLGIGRLLYGIYGNKMDLNKVLIYGSAMAAICYLAVALSPNAWVSAAACAVTGICVSLLWPGTLVAASEKLPFAGAAMFALLAAGGDIGASVGPLLTGVVTDAAMNILPPGLGLMPEQLALRAGILIAVIYPVLSMFFQITMRKRHKIETVTE